MAGRSKKRARGDKNLQNKKSFLDEIKSIFHNFQGLSFSQKRKIADISLSSYKALDT